MVLFPALNQKRPISTETVQTARTIPTRLLPQLVQSSSPAHLVKISCRYPEVGRSIPIAHYRRSPFGLSPVRINKQASSQDIIFASMKYSPNITCCELKRKKFELPLSPSVQRPRSSEIGHVQLLQSTPGTILANKSPPEGQARDIWSLGEVRHRGMRFRQAHEKWAIN